jgi:hypothetical protein
VLTAESVLLLEAAGFILVAEILLAVSILVKVELVITLLDKFDQTTSG